MTEPIESVPRPHPRPVAISQTSGGVVTGAPPQQPVEMVLRERHQCFTAVALRASSVAAMIFCSLRSDRPDRSRAGLTPRPGNQSANCFTIASYL